MDENSVSGDNVEQAHKYEPGWSDGVPAVESKPVAQNHQYEPGWSNRGAVSNAVVEDVAEAKTVSEAETKVVEPETVEDKAVKAPAKKAAAKKTATKKG